MTIRGDSKAVKLNTATGQDDRRRWPCPHPFCFEFIFGHRRDLLDHFQEKHKCGRCNQGKHHKCRKDLCACGCRWDDPTNETYDPKVLSRLMEMALKRPKIDGEKLNQRIKELMNKT